MATTFGLELVVQREPVFQVYVTVGPQFRGQTEGEPLLELCGLARAEKGPNGALHVRHSQAALLSRLALPGGSQ